MLKVIEKQRKFQENLQHEFFTFKNRNILAVELYSWVK